MNRHTIFPNHRFIWFLSRATLVCGAFGVVLAVALLGVASTMGDGGGDSLGMAADSIPALIPYVVGWAVLGSVFGLLWWLLSKVIHASQWGFRGGPRA